MKTKYFKVLYDIGIMIVPLGSCFILFGISSLLSAEFFRLEDLMFAYDCILIFSHGAIGLGVLMISVGFVFINNYLTVNKEKNDI